MYSRYSIKTLFLMSIAMLAVLVSKAQLASEKPMPKRSDWMSKVEQNRNIAQKQVNAHKTATVIPAATRLPQNPQPFSIQPDRRSPVNKPAATGQQPVTGQKSQVPVRPKVKDGGQ